LYFDNDLKPLVNTDAGMKAIEKFLELKKHVPPGVLTWKYPENHAAFLSQQTRSLMLWLCMFKHS